MFATYVHDLDPVIFSITESIKLRWYGLAYLMAFVVGYLLLKRLGERGLWVLPGKVAGDFIAYAAFFGVFLGGRIGNVLVYQRAEFLDDPAMVFRVWEGGMASHGGILGLMIFTLVYSRMKKVSWTGLGDGLCVVAPLGIMFGRLANFINGELYGRVDRGFAWAMKFPDTLWDGGNSDKGVPASPEHEYLREAQMAAAQASDGGEYAAFYERMATEGGVTSGEAMEALDVAIREEPGVKEAVGEFLLPRYPSQLFQAAGEGLCLFLILWFVRVKFPKLAHGVLTGLFFIFYAVFRISMEQFREPEIDNVTVLGLEFTMGQFLSLFMILIGAGFIAVAKRRVGKASILRNGGL